VAAPDFTLNAETAHQASEHSLSELRRVGVLGSSGGCSKRQGTFSTCTGRSHDPTHSAAFAPDKRDCTRVVRSQSTHSVQFDLANNNDEAHGGHIVEQLSLGTWLEIIGNGTGRLHASTIVATGTASLWYCPSAGLTVSVFRLCELPFQRPAADIHAAVSRLRSLLGLHATWITRSALGCNARAGNARISPADESIGKMED
jgi:hypothetical protein